MRGKPYCPEHVALCYFTPKPVEKKPYQYQKAAGRYSLAALIGDR